MPEYSEDYKDLIKSGAEATIYGKSNVNLISKRISSKDSIFPPVGFDSQGFWEKPEEGAREIVVAKKLSAHEQMQRYCITPIGYEIDNEKKKIDLFMPKADGRLNEKFPEFQSKAKQHTKHLLEGFRELVKLNVLQYDINQPNIMYVENEDLFKFIDFGASCDLDHVLKMDGEKAISLIRASYSHLLTTICFSLGGNLNTRTAENLHYLNNKKIIDDLFNENTQWNELPLNIDTAIPTLLQRIDWLISQL
jgi:hypothetical protein